MVEYADDFGMDNLSKKGKKNIKIAQKQNLDIQFGHKELLEDFDKVMKCTEERKGISLRTKEYYELLLDTYADDAFITLAYFHIHDMLKETKENIGLLLIAPVFLLLMFTVSNLYQLPAEYVFYLTSIFLILWVTALCMQYRGFWKRTEQYEKECAEVE